MKTLRTWTMCASVLMLALVNLGAPPASQAQGANLSVEAKIPFAFNIGVEHLDAGVYRFQQRGNKSFVSVTNGTQQVVHTFARSEEISSPSELTSLEFNKYGDRYFLSSIRVEGRGSYLRWPMTKSEKVLLIASPRHLGSSEEQVVHTRVVGATTP